MEDDNQDGPFTVWQMFNAPTMVLFNNLEHAADGLDRLLTSILKLSGDFSEVLVPRPGSVKYPDSYYNAFNTWLVGRLFYVWSVDELNRIHITSKDAQLKILNILCMNAASFYNELHSEYFSVLTKLIQYYKENPKEPFNELILENFQSEQVIIPNVQLNLEPIYVHVKEMKTCKTLIDLTLQLLAESLATNSIYINKHRTEYEKLFNEILYMLEHFSIDLKMITVKFFIHLASNYNQIGISKFHCCFSQVFVDFLYSLEAMIKSMNVFYEKGEIDDIHLDNFNKLMYDFMKMNEGNIEKTNDDVLLNICSVILRTQGNKIFSNELKLECLSLTNRLDFPRDIIDVSNMDTSEVEMLKLCYCKNILLYIDTNIQGDRAIDLKENWYYNQTMNVIMSLKTCEDYKIDIFLISYHLKRCLSGLTILQHVYIQGGKMHKTSNIQILIKEDIQTIWGSLLKILDCHRSIIIGDINLTKAFMDILLSTVILLRNASKEESNKVFQLLCLQTTPQFSEQSLGYGDSNKVVVIKYIMIVRLVLKAKFCDAWVRIISNLMNSIIKNKTINMYKEVIPLCPLVILNKIFSASKLIGDILMPAFLTKDINVQTEVACTVSAIACMSLGSYNLIMSTPKGCYGHSIFSNNVIDMLLICTKCHNLCNITHSKEYITKMKLNKVEIYSESNMYAPSQHSILTSLKNLFAKFLNWKQYSDLEASGYWELFGRLCHHYYVPNYGVSLDIMNEDNAKHVLKAFRSIVADNSADEDLEWKSQKEAAFSLCVNILVSSTRTSLENNDHTHQTNTLNLIKDFGLCSNGKVILPVTKLFVYFIMHPQCSLGPKAVVSLRDVCELHEYTPNQVYHRYKKDYCKLFVECSLYSGKEFAISLLKVVRAFGFVGYRDFISKDVHHFLPYLIPYSVTIKEVPSMIEEIASLVQCSVPDFLIDRFPHIYVHVYLNESKEVGKKCYDIIERLTKTSVLNLIKRHFRVILTEFLLQYCCDSKKVLNACRYLACHDPDVSTPIGSMSMSTSQIADFLNPKFLGVLAYFDHKLVNAKVALSVKRKALTSFPDIVQLMGVKYLTPLRFKVLATLRSALPLAKEFPKILADAWGAFIHNIDTMSLGPLLSNLAVSLLQQLDYAPLEINKIFHYLVLNNENLLSSHISDLFFLEDTKITEKIKMVIRRHVKRTQPDGFLDKIKWYLQHLNHDIPSIKAFAFSHLDKLLKSNRTEIHKAIFGGKNIDPVVVELIDSLLLGCKDSDSQVSLSSGACLGQLGAIEAGHLPRRYVQPDRSPFAFSIGDNCFAATALVELSRAFQYEKDTMNMDCYALTIQEILKIYDISPSGSKKDVWDSFPEHMHQIMHPLLSSRYTLAYPSQPKKAHPLFGSTYATTFLEWAHNWAGQLIPLIDSESIRELLRTVHPSMRRDVRTLFLFLPYVLLHAVMSKNNAQYIQEEILAVIGLENFEHENAVATERSKYKMLRHIRMTPSINSVQTEEGNQSKCSKTIYTLLDFLNRWLLEWCHTKQRPMENDNYKAISSFLDKFDKLTIARGNFACGELERALQYLELYMDEQKNRMQEQLPFLAEIYALLDEPDSVAGILSMKRSEPSLKELILAQVVTGRLQDAALCYERLAQEGQLDRHSLQGMIDCYLGLDQPFTAYRLLSEHEYEDDMMELSAEPLWRLGRFDQLDELVKKPVPPSKENWGLLMGRILLAYRGQDHDAFVLSCKDTTSRLLAQMDGESKGESALRSGYQSVLGLHIVTETGHAEEVLQRLKELRDGDGQSADILKQMLDEWRQRLSVVQSDVRTIEPLLRLRRILLHQSQQLLEPTHPLTASRLKACIGDLWLQSAKQARKAGIFQQSYMYILNAEEYQPEELFIEKSKMYWARGQHEQAFTTLRRGLDDTYPMLEQLNNDQRKTCAKAKLLIAKYNDETTNVDVDVNIGYYKEAVEVFKQWEKSLVCLGAYYEKVSSGDGTSTGTMWSRRLYALNSYGKALQYGHKYLYQSMPRMLSIWLDVEVTSTDTSAHSVLAQMTEIIKTYSERLPLYLYLTAFSQIVSRICHPVKEVYLQLKAIIVKLIMAYPQHTLWMMMCVIKSSYAQRIKRCADVFADPRLKEPHMLKLVNDFTQLAEKLIELCNKPIAGSSSTTTVSTLVRTLPRLLSVDNFSHIMMPFQEFCKIVLPSKAARQERIDFNIPTEPPVYIAGIEEQISILPSLQKPRKVTLKGSDGKSYIIMLKPRDDLRKDYRLMEFNGVVNRFLQDAPETRRRRLYIRTYSVLPLNEECGLIEWVPNLLGLRPILMQIYKQKGIHTSNRELKEMMCSNKDPVEKKRRIYEEQLLPRHPAVFQEWFRRVFSDPYGWYQARSAYIRTTAVMSMVGYILGLGDRHGENISFDSTNGDTVHVDFNCLFNKGEAFEWPERVPFRLTHNMRAAMGPLGHDGMFRKSCEAVMRALRAQTAALMSVIGPFVYDPLVSWGRVRPVDCGERTNEQALQHLLHIKQRLNGMPPSKENWGLLMGRILLAYRGQDHDAFVLSCKDTTSRLLAQMDGESKGESALRSGYQSVLGLHIVTETGHAEEVLQRLKELRDGDRQSADILKQMLDEWRQRLSVVQSDVRTIEPLLRLRRILLHQSQQLLEPTQPLTASRLKACIGDLWLQSAKQARKAGIFQQTDWKKNTTVCKGFGCFIISRLPDIYSPSPSVKLVSDFTQLAEKLIELCNKPIAGSSSTTTVSTLVRTLPRLLSVDNFSHIMMPFQEFCKIVLPSKAARQERIDFNIPTEPPVYIAGIEEQISILPSLQKPRKVTLKGSDGKSYIIMLKPRDDLRKDYRLMEFNGVVNRFLQDAPETRRRRLYIRTYSVLPLNEECGLIEWIPNLLGLRPILMQIYKQKGIHTSNRELKEMMCSNKDPVEKKRRIYEEQLLPRHPAVFQEWFRRVFSDPYGWYQARSAYIRTTAVMSMVGYILGLGDRHGENISFDSTNGDTVHVDFNCLFNKGEAFEWPERVPFRLTHNMRAAMGPLGHDGMFRKSCEAVMRALRAQTAALMSVIGPFVYDPLVSWGRVRPVDCGERTNEQALQHLLHIKQRLNGMPPSKENWGLLMGRILLAYRGQDHDAFVLSCKDTTSRLLAQMDGESKGESALRSGYQSVLGLHIVTETGHAEEVLQRLKELRDGDRQSADILKQMLDEWRQRLSVVQSDVRTIEPLLRLRRILLHQSQQLLEPTQPLTASRLKACIGDLWLQSAKQARKAGIFQQSYMYILNAEEYQPEELFIEKSKMYWARGQHEQAFTTLRRGLDDTYPMLEQLNNDQRKTCAKAKLLIAKYNDETTNVDVDVNIGYYKEAVEVFKQWEKSLVCLGAYYEKVSSGDGTSTGTMWSRRLYALNSYGKALQYGHKYLYQSMPRMLSIWLDVEVTSTDTSAHSVLAQMTEIIKTYSERLPLYLYLTAFSQIVSRICHPVKEVYLQLKAIIVKLIMAYPQHTLWMMMCVIKSSYAQRIKRCADVFADPRLKEPHMLKLVSDFTQLAEKLIELCNKPIAGSSSTTTVSTLVRTLPRLLSVDNFSHIMMPFQEFCKIVLPSKAARQERIDFNIPTEPPVYIAGIEEQISILPSLQKPRKVTLKGSDGKSYIIMLKPRDDLRKDYRLMEFNGVVNRFLQDAPETRRRRLYIRTYSVLPLNEECGLIEWVPNLLGLRPILMQIYKQKGIHTSNRELKEMMCSNKDPVEKKRRIYEEQLLPRHPAVFQEWFRRVFSDPYGWYQARSAYIRTTAVMSMVGYILGLGDRHGENISFDSTNGDTVHVDFNCLFNKGEAFEWPERVPFRLTHNMRAAMGPLGHDGMFRKSCEAVMRALRAQTAALMSVIGPFVYDPLVSWGRVRPVDCGERTNEQALQHLLHIKQRLNGMVRTKNKQLSLSLSPEGQVEHLIVEATSIHNLCQMYIGWGPFL